MMTRRIVRTSIKLGALTFLVFVFVFLLDNRFNVLPEAIHNALPAHHPGLVITDITVATCSKLNLLSSCKLDQNKWHRIEKDLYLSKGWLSHAFIHIERKRESELTEKDRVVLDVRIASLDPVLSEKDQGAEKWESRQAGIWIKRTARHRDADKHRAITAVDVLFGSDSVEARPGWERTPHPLMLPDSGGDNHGVYITVRRGPPFEVHKPALHINDNGKFKVLQLADLHFATGPGICREPEPADPKTGNCEADPRTLTFVNAILDEEKPDLVVLSGDQVNGETAPDAQTAIFKFAAPLIERKIPFATIFGNHDDMSLSREAQMQLTHSLPFSLSEPGPSNVDGIGNYVVEVLGRGGSSHSALTFYLLDTHSYSPDEPRFRGYDWLKKNQIEWFKSTAQELKRSPMHTGYKRHHMDMAFIHIPLPEYRITDDMVVPQTGRQLENPTAPGFNSGFKDALVEEGILAVSCGHDHVNDYCSLSKGPNGKPQLWMCYGGGVGFGGYGGYGGYHRRVRFFEFDMNEKRITTWKRVEWGEPGKRVDEAVIVDDGSVVALKH